MINSVTQYFLNESIKVSSKVWTLLLIILCVIVIDNITGFTFHKNNYEKITQLQFISELKGNNNLNNESNTLLSEIEKSINTRKSITDIIKKTVSSVVQTKFIKKNVNNKQVIPRNNLKLFIFSNWSLLALALILTPSIIMGHLEDGYDFKHKILTLIVVWIFTLILSLGSYLIIGLIPMIGNNWNVNYIIAFLSQPVLFFVFYLISKNVENKNKLVSFM